MITTLDTVSWAKELTTGNADFVETQNLELYIVSNVKNSGFGFGTGFGASFGNPYQFAVLKSDPVPPSPGPGASFGAVPPASLPKAVYTFPQPNLDFDPAVAFDSSTGLLHILGTRNTPTGGNQSSDELSDVIKFTYDTIHDILTGPFVIAASVGSRIRGAYDITVLPSGNTLVAMALTDFTGSNLTVVELDMNTNLPVSGTTAIIDSSPSRTGNTFDGVSILVNDIGGFGYGFGYSFGAGYGAQTGFGFNFGVGFSGPTVEIYYQSHPKVFTFVDQIFNVNSVWNSTASPVLASTWSSPTTLTTFTARYTDNRLTALMDNFGDRYMSLTYWSQLNHPEGIVGSVLVGTKQAGEENWFFHPTLGTTIGGSLVQSALSIAQNGDVNLVYLLQPFVPVANPPLPSASAWPLQVATVNPTTLGLTNVPGFYNGKNFTWLRGTKSLIDNASSWSVVGESEAAGSILPVYASLYNIPPIAAITPTFATVWRGGTFYATDVTRITHFVISGDTITVTCLNNFTAGQQVAIYGFTISPNLFLNGNTLTVLTATSTFFTANFAHSNATMATPDSGSAAMLIPGTLILNASGSADADNDALQFVWTENDSNQTDVYLTAMGALAAVNVLRAVGPDEQRFDAGAAVIDLYPDLVTQRHPALVVTDIMLTGGTLMTTFTAPTGAIIPIAGEKIMFYNIVLGAPAMPTVSVTPGGSLPEQTVSDSGFGSNFGNNFSNPISVIVTYLNSLGKTLGETVGSVSNTTLSSIPANHRLVVQSPANAGHAEYYNVYVGPVGSESLQTFTPRPLGTNWTELLTGLNSVFIFPPTTNTAIDEALNDQVFTLYPGTNSTTLKTTGMLGYGYDFSFDFGTSTFPITVVTGSAISQYQFEQVSIVVPKNVAPVAVFPHPQWGAGNVLATTVARNTPNITITPGVITDPTTQFPVVYTGLTDPDDIPFYSWAQVSGSTVSLPKGTNLPSLIIDTAGVSLNGENLVFSLTLNDSVNPPYTTQFTVPVAAYVFNSTNQDYLQLSRSIFAAPAPVTSITIFDGVGTITANNTFSAGQTVWFEGTNATFLEGAAFTVSNTGFGSAFSAGFGGSSVLSTSFQIMDNSLPNFTETLAGSPPEVTPPESGTAYSAMPISMRNTAQTWSPLDISIIFTNLRNVKRTSVLDGSDRFILISPYSVLVYGVFPNENPATVLMRKLFLPNTAQILDAVHTEQDYTLVLDTEGNIWRYTEAPLVNTDNPDTRIVVGDYTSLSFIDTNQVNDVRIFTTVSFGNQRVVVLSGDQGAVLIQMNTTTLAVTGTLTLDIASNYVYGANKVQFVRWVNMNNLRSGRILLGTILNNSAEITNVAISAGSFNGSPVTTPNTLVITAQNNFVVGDVIIFSGLTNAAFLNGAVVTVVAASATQFEASYEYTGVYGPVGEVLVGSAFPLAQSQTSGSTYETLIDLSANQIIGTFDKSKLKNQFVETGEILFDPDDTYAGGPTPPVLLPPTTVMFGGVPQIKLVWQQQRPDLINSYTVQYAIENPVAATVPFTVPYTIVVPSIDQFTADAGVFDAITSATLQRTGQTSPSTGQYYVDESTGTYTFNQAQAGDSIVITVRQAFQNLQIVNSGNVQSIYVPLPIGRTYFFQVQASGLDGTSGFSNIEFITI